MEQATRILIAATEAAPFAKEGGVADVIGSLPKELAALGHDVRVFLPRYGTIDPAHWELSHTGVARTFYMSGYDQTISIWQGTLPGSNVPIYFLDHAHFFAPHQRMYLGQTDRDEQRRFLLFCKGMLEALPALDFWPDVFHLNDWQTSAAAAYLRTSHRYLLRPSSARSVSPGDTVSEGRTGAARIVYTIHNLQYQGRWDPSILDEAGLDRTQVFVPDGLEYWGDVNWMKAGITYADAITTVSRRYAEEIQTLDSGWGLDEVLFQRHPRVFGIPNGIDWDDWNPATDPHLAVSYGEEDATAGKERNRTALREEFGLPDEPEVPLVGIVSRLVDQKGFDLLAALAEELPRLPLQLVVLGTGHASYERLFRTLSETAPNVRTRIGFDVPLSHRIYAGCDFFLMPSAFEPGGLGQLIALRYGTLPLVRATGGLADTVTDLDTNSASGNGLSFTPYEPAALLDTLQRALRLYTERDRWPGLVARAMTYDSRWSASARAYADLYRRVLRLPPT
ncbi:MAG TPA: glycogen/starch synthase [Ktedonobacterales bacterium]|nr:glycogen/starch synthase [Ktedonobacterales bacterium]